MGVTTRDGGHVDSLKSVLHPRNTAPTMVGARLELSTPDTDHDPRSYLSTRPRTRARTTPQQFTSYALHEPSHTHQTNIRRYRTTVPCRVELETPGWGGQGMRRCTQIDVQAFCPHSWYARMHTERRRRVRKEDTLSHSVTVGHSRPQSATVGHTRRAQPPPLPSPPPPPPPPPTPTPTADTVSAAAASKRGFSTSRIL